ncbi:MAG: hypothetical protein A3H96_00140 [Acidobacteria bacterium RIFCSPLOWO2_02_FULL_67_36]|nr:MAG: hypothetical protein A3H96_00140 [Acidobacteria bacterium RIFCSPLOWO2_02_FULL_67_36]OFW19599.1 MAG: hypothetical protein A3G21_21580 [Acidobacteria bacterium RIFCSPLOWO2_12_FULL_66_21]
MRIWILALLVPAALSVPARAAAQLARHPYDVTSYDLNIRPDFTTGEISLRARVAIARARGTDAFRFGLSPRYRDVSVRANGHIVDVERARSTVTVPNAAHDADVVLEFALAGTLGKSDDEDRDAIDRDSLFLLWSDRFYPIDYADWARVRTSILLPHAMPVVAPGVEISATPTSAGTWHIFESRTPAVKFSVVADRRWVSRTWRLGGLRMTTLLDSEVAALAPALHRTASDIVAYFTRLHGYYPADAFTFVTVRGIFARRALSGCVAYEPGYLKRTMDADGYDAHETSLLWWGYALHGEGPGAFQWTEGFGDYVEVMYTEARHKPLSVNLRRARERYEALGAADISIERLTGNSPQPVIHGRLPWLMDRVRKEIGDARFRAAIRTLFTRFRWRTFTLDEFVSVFERAAPPASRQHVRALLQGR